MSDFYTKQLQQLVGGKITAVLQSSDEDEPFFGLQIKVGKKTMNFWIMADDEGNGPGSFSIE